MVSKAESIIIMLISPFLPGYFRYETSFIANHMESFYYRIVHLSLGIFR